MFSFILVYYSKKQKQKRPPKKTKKKKKKKKRKKRKEKPKNPKTTTKNLKQTKNKKCKKTQQKTKKNQKTKPPSYVWLSIKLQKVQHVFYICIIKYTLEFYDYLYSIISKVGDRSRGRLESSLFNSHYNEV